MIGDSSGLFPHFLGILSKPQPGSIGSAGSTGELSHPFSSRVPPLRRNSPNPGLPPRNGVHGGPVFNGGGGGGGDNNRIQVDGAIDRTGPNPPPSPRPRPHPIETDPSKIRYSI